MTSVVQGQSTLQSMTYGPDSKRLSLTDASGTRKFFYDGNDVIQEYNSSWTSVSKEYTHGPWVDEPLSMTDKTAREAGDTYYLLVPHNGFAEGSYGDDRTTNQVKNERPRPPVTTDRCVEFQMITECP